MKNVLLLVLVLIIALPFAACGDGNGRSENNQIMQAKLAEADALVQQICNGYIDNGLLEGDTSQTFQTTIDTLKGQILKLKSDHQGIMDAGGFTDEDVAALGPIIDSTIAGYEQLLEEQAAYIESKETEIGIAVVTDKYNKLHDLVIKASIVGAENGWTEYESFNDQLDNALIILEVTKTDLDNPLGMDEEHVKEINASFDELINFWQEYMVKVSEPNSAK